MDVLKRKVEFLFHLQIPFIYLYVSKTRGLNGLDNEINSYKIEI